MAIFAVNIVHLVRERHTGSRKTLHAVCPKPRKANHFGMPLIECGVKSLQRTCLCIRREFLHTVQQGLLHNDALQLVTSSGSYKRYSQMSLCYCRLYFVHNNNKFHNYTGSTVTTLYNRHIVDCIQYTVDII